MSFKCRIVPIIVVFAIASMAAAFARQNTKGAAGGSGEILPAPIPAKGEMPKC